MRKLFFIFLFFLFIPSLAKASDFVLLGANELSTGDVFEMRAVLEATEPINALEGIIKYPKDNLELLGLKKGNSIINLWIDVPHSLYEGAISFSGIIPGGWQGKSGLVLIADFKVKKEGLLTISAEDFRLLKNDGFGSSAETRVIPLEVSVFKRALSSTSTADLKEKEQMDNIEEDEENNSLINSEPEDNDAPETFKPQIVSEDLLYDGKNVLIFYTQDKGSGMDSFKIKEVRYKFLNFLVPWKEIKSPFVLDDQSLSKTIIIKAVDRDGNERIEVLKPTNPVKWYLRTEVCGGTVVLIVLLALLVRRICKALLF